MRYENKKIFMSDLDDLDGRTIDLVVIANDLGTY